MCPVSPMMNMSEPTDPGCYSLSLSAMPLAGGGRNSSMGGMGGMGAPTVQAGECSMLSFSVMRNGAHVADLNPYLEASTHVFIVSSNLENSYHVHGMAASQMTPQMRTCMHMDHDAAPSTFSSPVTPFSDVLTDVYSACTQFHICGCSVPSMSMRFFLVLIVILQLSLFGMEFCIE